MSKTPRYTVSRKLTGGWYLREAGEVVGTFPLESKARAAAYAINLYDSGIYGDLESRVADLRADLALMRETVETVTASLKANSAPSVEPQPVLYAVEDKLDELARTAEGLRGIADDLEHDGRLHEALEHRCEADALVEEADNLRAEAGLAAALGDEAEDLESRDDDLGAEDARKAAAVVVAELHAKLHAEITSLYGAADDAEAGGCHRQALELRSEADDLCDDACIERPPVRGSAA